MMDLDELQSVQSRERQTDTLQQLRESFYREAGAYITGLREERERAAERADDPWNSPEISRLSDDIQTAEGTVEAIYERRVGKIVKMASLAAADMPTDDEGLTAEERQLFDSLVAEIEANRDRVEAILDGESPAAVDETSVPSADSDDAAAAVGSEREGGNERDRPGANGGKEGNASVDDGRAVAPETERDPSDADPDSATTDLGAADLMGEGSSDGRGDADPAASPDREPAGSEEPTRRARDGGRATEETDAVDEGPATVDEGPATVQIARSTVRITADVGEILGVDQRSYDLSPEDVVTLPEANVDPLVENGAAERLE